MTANEKLAADGCYVEVATRENHLHVGCGCRIEAYADGKQILGNRMISRFGEQSVEFGDIHVEERKRSRNRKICFDVYRKRMPGLCSSYNNRKRN